MLYNCRALHKQSLTCIMKVDECYTTIRGGGYTPKFKFKHIFFKHVFLE